VLGDVVAKLSGQPIEVFLENRIFRPLGMTDTGYAVPPAGQARVATLHQRKDGQLTEIPNPHTLAVQPRGDGRLFSTAADYCRFVQMILNHGQTRDTRLLKAETVREMVRSQTGDIKVRLQPTVNADYAKPFPLGAGEDGWGFGFQIASRAKWDPARRRPGSLSWAGINNTFFWIDPREEIAVIVLMQLLPFYDEAALGVLQGVETRVYQHLRSPGSY
jgi:CubicO group peptidase (beta-lactamase class C family)